MSRRFFSFSLLALSVFTYLVIASTANAAPVAFREIDITSHPEQGATMLLVRGELPEETSLPATAELSVPEGAELSWVGEILGGDPSADPAVEYDKRTVDGMDVYGFTLKQARVAQIEVKVPDVAHWDGTDYAAAMVWRPTQDTAAVRMSVRIPQAAQVTQEATGAALEPGPEGFSYYSLTEKDVKAGQALELAFHYSAPAPTEAAVPAPASSSNGFALAIVLALALGGMAFVATRIRRKMGERPGSDDEGPRDDDSETRGHEPRHDARRTDDAVRARAQRRLGDDPPSNALPASTPGAVWPVFGAAILILVGGVAFAIQSANPEPAGTSMMENVAPQPSSGEPVVSSYQGDGAATQTQRDLPQTDGAAEKGTTYRIDTSTGSYSPESLQVPAGTPTAIEFGQASGCLSDVLFPSLGLQASLEKGPARIELPALEPGVYAFQCGMDMQRGQVVVQ